MKSTELAPETFDRVRKLLYEIAGIRLEAGKEELVKARLLKKVNELELEDFESYLDHVRADKSGSELKQMVDVLTTNKTSFFREPEHFEFLRSELAPAWGKSTEQRRIWCAGCSSGEEAYTIAMTLEEALPAATLARTRILATDISERVLDVARQGQYPDELLQGVSAERRRRFFQNGSKAGTSRVQHSLQQRIAFARLNLMGAWPMHGPFDVIFCRNVMIYFDKPTQTRLVNRYYDLLPEGGHFFVSLSESLSGVQHKFEYVAPGAYRK